MERKENPEGTGDYVKHQTQPFPLGLITQTVNSIPTVPRQSGHTQSLQGLMQLSKSTKQFHSTQHNI